MRKLLALLMVWVLALGCVCPVFAQEGKVTYDGGAQKFVFAPGSEASPTDLFPDFKGVMPGDVLTQKISVKNEASNRVKVKIYLRSLGAQEGSEAFLSQLGLQVENRTGGKMEKMFDAAASEKAQLADWVCLGTLYSGGVADLDVKLHVPVELDNTFQEKVGVLTWEFKVEEFPIESSDPEPPTGGSGKIGWGVAILCVAAFGIGLILWKRRKDNDEK